MAHGQAQVLVVGGGPVGLTMASELYRHGVPCRVIDVKTEREVWSKAAAIQSRTLEVFRFMGIADRAVDMGNRVHGLNVFVDGQRLAHLDISIPGTSYDFLLGLSQRCTEELLESHLQSVGGALERGVELTDMVPDDDGVSVTLAGPAGSEQLRVPWLVGCDGARSSVRKALGLPFEGTTFEQELIHADLTARLPEHADRGEAHMFVSPSGGLGFLPLFGERRYRLVVMAPGERNEPTLDNFRAHVAERAPGVDIELSDPEWMTGFRFHSRIVPRYRQGRVFLAGDAAHIHSPAGGQGMNLGIQDAFNLAWKLAGVCKGTVSESLLDSYDPERRPVGERIVFTTDAATKRAARVISLRNPIATGLRNQLLKAVLASDLLTERFLAGASGITVEYGHSPAVGEYHSSIWRASLTHDNTSETPGLSDWWQFERGPGAGERVADIDIPDTEHTLFDLLAVPRHTLLLFDGASPTAEGYRNLQALSSWVASTYGDRVAIHIVLPRRVLPEEIPADASIIRDHEFELHAHFGARSEALFLVRPDGYVGYRSQPADREHLADYLASVFGT